MRIDPVASYVLKAKKYQNRAFVAKREPFYFFEELVTTKNLYECAKTYNKLLHKRYTITLENNIVFSFYFTVENFFHLLGLEKIGNINEFGGKSKRVIFKMLLNGTFPIKAIQNHKRYYRLKPRVDYFESLEKLLNKQHSKIVIEFNPELVENTKLINTKYIFYAHERTGYTHLTIAKRSREYYPETFIYENSKRYISEQNLLDVLDISIEPM